MTDPALFVGNSRPLHKPPANGIAPNLRVPSLEFKPLANFAKPLLIYERLQFRPLVEESGRALCAVVMRIVKVLDDRFARVQLMRVWHVMHEEQQIVRASGKRLERRCDGPTIL